MKIPRYRWTAKGMIYDLRGDLMNIAAHDSVVRMYQQQILDLINTKAVQVMSLEQEVAATQETEETKESALTAALAQIDSQQTVIDQKQVEAAQFAAQLAEAQGRIAALEATVVLLDPVEVKS